MSRPTQEQIERAILAAANRTEDPLKTWRRLQNEECPICMLPVPFHPTENIYCVTCGKTVCLGCVIGTGIAHVRDSGDEEKATEKATTCPFCRSDTRDIDIKYMLEQVMKRANNGNGDAMYHLGNYYFHGKTGLQQDMAEGLKWYHRALEAGSGEAAFFIAIFYGNGDSVDQDHGKAFEYIQKAADHGYIPAFVLIGDLLMNIGEIEEGMLNYRKAVICGISDEYPFKLLRSGFAEGFITKDEYAFTLRENQKAYNEMKSEGREMWKSRKSRNAS